MTTYENKSSNPKFIGKHNMLNLLNAAKGRKGNKILIRGEWRPYLEQAEQLSTRHIFKS
jgi:hypothetical protein